MEEYKPDPLETEILEKRKRIEEAFRKECEEEELTENEEKAIQEKTFHIKPKLFSIGTYLKGKNVDITVLCNFTKKELGILKGYLVPEIKITKHARIGLKSRIFIALFAFTTNDTYKEMQAHLSIPDSTISDIVKECIKEYFPIWRKAFIPSEAGKTYAMIKQEGEQKKQFDNFPWCIGAVDTTTIEFLKPKDEEERRKSWDAKNKINGRKLEALVAPDGQALYANAQYLGAVHDKRIFDESGIKDFITQTIGMNSSVFPVMADKGYTGIRTGNANHEVMKKNEKKDPQKRAYNKNMAHDRQIVERWNCRFKINWAMMGQRYRGNRKYLEDIIMGITALTNFYNKIHPLDDETNESKEKKSTDSKNTHKDSPSNQDVKKESTQIVKKESPQIVKKTSKNGLTRTQSECGIYNQGSTCHLNVTLQLLYSIPETKQAIIEIAKKGISPIKEMFDVFSILDKKQNPATTTSLTAKLGNEWTNERSLDDSVLDLLNIIISNANKINQSDVKQLFKIILPSGEEKIMQVYYTKANSVINLFKLLIHKDEESIYFSKYIVLLCGPEANKIQFDFELDLSNISSTDTHYYLSAVIAYNNHHLVYFKKKNQNWYYINDENCYIVNEEIIIGLQGGSSKEHKEMLKLLNRDWKANLLLYSNQDNALI